MDPRDPGFPDHVFDAEEIDNPPQSIGLDGLIAMRAHLARTTDGRCKDCGEAIPPNGSVFIGLDRLCCDCASDRKVTP